MTANIPFKDMKETDWFCKAVIWTVENGITSGTSAATFSPKNVIEGQEYMTDDNSKVYCCDGACISNDSYVTDGHRYYTDDFGRDYRIDNSLLPDSEYEVNGYKYRTDSQARIISA